MLNKIYVTTEVEGHYPVGTAFVIVASDKKAARELLWKSIVENGLHHKNPRFEVEQMRLDLITLNKPQAICLMNGDY